MISQEKNGFTLIEMLIVLSLFSILLVFTVPTQFHSLNNQTEQRFIAQLEQDVLYIQNQAGLNDGKLYQINFYDEYYQIYDRRNPLFTKRNYPESWKIIQAYSRNVRFTETGTLRQPRTIVIFSDTERIAIVFPFGKGRFYVEKEKRVFPD